MNNDALKVGQLTANWMALGNLLQLFVAPNIGRLSDAIGRKPVLILLSVISVVLKAIAAFNPRSITALGVESIVCRGLSYFTVFSLSSAYVSDLCTKQLRTWRYCSEVGD